MKMKKTNEHEMEKLLAALTEDGAPNGEETDAAAETNAQSQNPSAENADKEAEFEKLIKGEFKKQFEQRIKDNLKRRFKESSPLKAKAARNEQIINMLMMKYGIKNEDTDSLIKAIDSDDGFIKNEAQKSGIDTDTLKRLKQLEYENEMMKYQMKKEKDAQAMEQTVKAWMEDGKFLKDNYPDFDIETEAENPAFVKLLRGGADLKSAYLAMHHDEIVKNLVEKAAQEAQEKTAEAIRARGQRPLENGMSGKSTALFKTDVSRLTPAQRAEIARRVANGETISF